jgi:lipoyl synthase
VRQHWDHRIWFSAPGAKHYESSRFSNHPYSFVNLSVTGNQCACHCDHCNAGLLQTMIPAETPEKMHRIIDGLAEHGCQGILVSGGADCRGEVPLMQFMGAIRYARQRGLAVVVHAGLIQPETAAQLKDCDVDQVLVDVIGHTQTIHDVYHLDRTPDDYLQAMITCREVGLDFVPHVVIGLHYGEILGEYESLRMIREVQPQMLVLVILTPTPGTAMGSIYPPDLSEAQDIMAMARIWNPDMFLSLGCARPPGFFKNRAEIIAIDCGFNGIAFPGDEAIAYADSRGLLPVFSEKCCSLSGRMDAWI